MSNTSSNNDSEKASSSGGGLEWADGLVGYFKDIFNGLKSLVVGLRRTLYYFTHHKEIITQEYPDNRETMNLPERFKGEVVLLHDENNEHACTGCTA
jgi:NADH-quinone oxidoreductase subunit I